MVSSFASFKPFRRAPRRRPARERGLLHLEELEARTVLSAAGNGLAALPPFQPAGDAFPAHHRLHHPPGQPPGPPILANADPSTPSGYSPSQIRHGYGFDQIAFLQGLPGGYDGNAGQNQTIAIVDAYDDPKLVNSTASNFNSSDLHNFDVAFGLSDPPSFKKVDQGGGTNYPQPDPGWALEISLDVEWAHAIAPRANILLVEANSASSDDLLTAVDYARHAAGVSAVSMSWGAPELLVGLLGNERALDAYFTTPADHTGVTFVASAGDSSALLGPSWPAISPNVLSVGGTTLFLDSQGNRVPQPAELGQSELGWTLGGGGLSLFEPEPDYQKSVQPTGFRTNPDVAYDADPNTGFSVYDSYGYQGSSGWFVVGGTSAGAPQWAALVAIANQGRALANEPALDGAQADIYSLSPDDFHDITLGFNGFPATVGYDLVTGRGSPIANLVVEGLKGPTTPPPTPSPSPLPVPVPFRLIPLTSVGEADALAGPQTADPGVVQAARPLEAGPGSVAPGAPVAMATTPVGASLPPNFLTRQAAPTAVVPAAPGAAPAPPLGPFPGTSPRPAETRVESGAGDTPLPNDVDEGGGQADRPVPPPDAPAGPEETLVAPTGRPDAVRTTAPAGGDEGDRSFPGDGGAAGGGDALAPLLSISSGDIGRALDPATASAGLIMALRGYWFAPARKDEARTQRWV